MAGLTLTLFSESTLGPVPATPNSIKCCPTLDISATVLNRSHLLVHRRDAEPVLHISKNGTEMTALKWKADGSALALAWGNHNIELIGLDNKGSHHIKLTDENGDGHITCIGWARCSIGKQRSISAEEWQIMLHRGGLGAPQGKKTSIHDLVPGLPQQVSYFEVDPAFPKLGPLPVTGNPSDLYLFSTAANIDFVFPSLLLQSPESVDILVSGTCHGMLHLHMYDTFEIGVFDLRQLKQPQGGRNGFLQLRDHAAASNVTTHSLLLADDAYPLKQLWHLPMDMTNLVKSPIPLTLLANKVVTLRNLMRYTEQAVLHIQREFNAMTELPKRLMAGVQEDLQNVEGGPLDIYQTLYHMAVTGNPHPIVKEWLVESLAERGHKRWDKTVTSGLEKIRDLTQQNLIPALNRMHIVLSRLLGLASYYNGEAEIGFTPSQISRLVEHGKCLKLVSELIISRTVTELDHFKAFSAWLRAEIDRLATANPSDEISDKEALRDNSMVINYLRRHLPGSKLNPLLAAEKPLEGSWAAEHQTFERASSLLSELEAHINKQESRMKYTLAYPQVQFLLQGLRMKITALLGGISESQKRTVHLGTMSPICIGAPISKWATRVSKGFLTPRFGASVLDVPGATSVTALITYDQVTSVYLFSTAMEIVNGISKVVSHKAAGFTVPSGAVVDVRFINDRVLGLLWRHEHETTLLAVPLHRNDVDFPEWGDFDGKSPINITILDADKLAEITRWFHIPQEDEMNFSPHHMEIVPPCTVSGYLPGRLCLMDKTGHNYKVFEMPPPETLLVA